ncbi:hypothetical protein Bbelb_356320 [Branchiostoma belcheri]|nr:hypothetical protein Bbelb_422920 [Branchiostoma belcheri]KAI8486657.1 hypothetical protein Bbelb_356320 [Branchiostoma belcheri]
MSVKEGRSSGRSCQQVINTVSVVLLRRNGGNCAGSSNTSVVSMLSARIARSDFAIIHHASPKQTKRGAYMFQLGAVRKLKLTFRRVTAPTFNLTTFNTTGAKTGIVAIL